MKDLIVTLLQESIEWRQPSINRARFGRLLHEQAQGSDLIILPEMFTTGFDISSTTAAEDMGGETLHWLREQAATLNAHITGSVLIRDGKQYFNRLLWLKPDGSLITYDKRHLFTLDGEDLLLTAGKERVIVDCHGWRCCPQICYDLRFPVWSRNQDDYDLLIYVANWPRPRIHHWSALLTARSIENLSYVVGVNRIGEDGAGRKYNGQSVALGPNGKPLVEPGSRAGCYTVTLDYEELQRYREKFSALHDRDHFQIIEPSAGQ